MAKRILGFLLAVIVENVSLTNGQKPWPCAYRSSTVCGYYMSNNPSDFSRSNQICQYYDDSILASIEVAKNLNSNGKLKWIGFRQRIDDHQWYWIGDGRSLEANITRLFSRQNNSNATTSNADPLASQSTTSVENCVAVHGNDHERHWLITPCEALLNETLCQRPLRNKCHRWNFTYGCLWEDETCEHRFEEKAHDSDDELDRCPNASDASNGRYFRRPCEPEYCENCKLTMWSQWSTCSSENNKNSDACESPGFKVRHRSVLVESKVGKSCAEYGLVGKKSCLNPCPSLPTTTLAVNKTVRLSRAEPTNETTQSVRLDNDIAKDASISVNISHSNEASPSIQGPASKLTGATETSETTTKGDVIKKILNHASVNDSTIKSATSFQSIVNNTRMQYSRSQNGETRKILNGESNSSWSFDESLTKIVSLLTSTKGSGLPKDETALYVYISLASIIGLLLSSGLCVLLICWSKCCQRKTHSKWNDAEYADNDEDDNQQIHQQSKTRGHSPKLCAEITRDVSVDFFDD